MTTYKQSLIYRYLRRNGPCSSRHLSEALGLTIKHGQDHPCKAATEILQKLRTKGLARRVGNTYEWEVMPNTSPPRDKRGKSKGSRLALQGYGKINIAKLHAKLGYTPRPIATTALEQCWGWLPLPSRDCEGTGQ
jgi:hypothetical protein